MDFNLLAPFAKVAKLTALLLLLGLLLLSACTEAPAVIEADPLIPFDLFFAQRSYDAPKISPDGSLITWIGPAEGAMNFYVASADDPSNARALTTHRGRGIQARDVSGVVMYRFSRNGRYLIYPMDDAGDENWNLFAVDVKSGENRNLTNLDQGRAELLGLSDSDPNKILIGISETLSTPADLYELDLKTAGRQLIQRSGSFLGFVADNELRPRIALAFGEAGGIDYLTSIPEADTRDANAGESDDKKGWSPVFTVHTDDIPAVSASGYQKIVRIDRKNEKVYFYDSRGRDKIALVSMDLTTHELEIVAADEKSDIGGVLYHPTEHTPQAFVSHWARRRWVALDDAIEADLDFLQASTEGDVDIVSRSDDDRRWIVRFMQAHEPEQYSLYEREVESEERSLTALFITTPDLQGLKLSKMHPLLLKSRDGLDLVSYLSLPPWLDPDDTGRPEVPVPIVLLVHGGPSDERAQYAYGPFVHWLTNRGYGVLYANFRGSPGFGKAFVNAQRLEWGGKMHDDLIDQVEWAITEKVTTPDKVAILGGSYGGYATLVGMTLTPEVFACGVDLVGPSNLEIFMPHWNVDTMSKVIGDPRTEEGRALLRSRSPIQFADQAKHPILIAQGANDSRVPQEQSDSMVEVFVENDVPVTYMLYPDEGHGLQRPENTRSFWAVAEVFLAQCLGGRAQPLTDELVPSSAEVLAGAEHVEGLESALALRESASPF